MDTWLMLARPDLRTAEEAARRWFDAAALARPADRGGKVVAVGDPAQPALQALVRWDPAGFAEREADERSGAHLPPASRIAVLTGPPDAVESAVAGLRLPPGAELLGPVPQASSDDGEAPVRLVRARPAPLGRRARPGARRDAGGARGAQAAGECGCRWTPTRWADQAVGDVLGRGRRRLRRLACRPPRGEDPSVSIQPIRLFGDPVLRTPAGPVVDFDLELRKLVQDLTETMMDAPGAGLAAPQIGVGLRVFTWYVDGEVGHLVNPDLSLSEETQDGEEGCLSIPDIVFDCKRAMSVVARGFNMHGDPVTIEGSELLARAIQHETDHLDGILFIERLDPETRKQAMRAIRESEWFGAPPPDDQAEPAPHARPRALMRVVFAGTPEVALPGLRAIAASSHDLVGVVTRPDAPQGRGRKLVASPVAEVAEELGVPVLKPGTPRSPTSRSSSASWPPTAARWSPTARCFPQSALDIPPHGWVNLHFSILPAWRGAAPVQRALWAGDAYTGATTFRIVQALDAGPTYGVVTERVRETDTAGDLLGRLAEAGAPLLVATLDGIEDGSLEARPQPEDGVSLAPKILVEDAEVRWTEPALAVDRRIRACTPAPGAWTTYDGERLKLGPVRPEEDAGSLEPGQVAVGKSTVHVGTATVPVRLGEVKPFGKKQMAAADWARGLRGAGDGLRFGAG